MNARLFLQKHGKLWALLGLSWLLVTVSSQLWIPAIIYLFAWILRPFLKTIPLRKMYSYGAVLPFGLWFLLEPTQAQAHWAGISAWIFWIPAWFFASLGLQQLWSIGRGGERRFVWWNAAAALGLSMAEHAWWSWLVVALWTLLWILDFPHSQGGRTLRSWGLVFLGSGVLALLLWWAQPWLNSYAMQHSRWNPGSHQMKGFDPVTWLGSFASEYESPWEHQVVLRVISTSNVDYMRAMVHSKYQGGVWLSADLDQIRLARGNYLEYGVFGHIPADEMTDLSWVKPSLETFGYLFMPLGIQGFALIADSVQASSSGVVRSAPSIVEHGYYLGRVEGSIDSVRDMDRQVPLPIQGLLDTTLAHWFPQGNLADVNLLMGLMRQRFEQRFQYSLTPRVVVGEDPVRTFLREKRGYCEYFATAATLLLRRSGHPARLVTGFAKPEHIGDAWVYRRSDAHAWVEVWDSHEWRIFDPTPSASFPVSKSWNTWDHWQEGRQLRAIVWWHSYKDGAWRKTAGEWGTRLGAWFIAGGWHWLGLVGLVWILRRFRLRKRMRTSVSQDVLQWHGILAKAEQRLQRQGLHREPWETVGDWLLRLPPTADPDAVRQLQEYQQQRFQKR